MEAKYCFLIIRRTPRSTLFPFKTLVRSIVAVVAAKHQLAHKRRLNEAELMKAPFVMTTGGGLHQFGFIRSEEHTSELQSRLHLVCRLLLEKKQNQREKAKSHTNFHTM